MSMIMTMISLKSMSSLNPMTLAITILVVSISTTTMMFKTTTTSWICFVVILTFSSGMMTLFMYTTSMTANEKSKHKKGYLMMAPLLMITVMNPSKTEATTKQTMLTFSNKMLILMFASVLIFTMMAISMQGHHPNQTISSSF